MKTSFIIFSVVFAIIASVTSISVNNNCYHRHPFQPTTNMNTAIQPVAPEDVQGDKRWMSIHQRFVSQAKEQEPDVLFLGDSITQQLQNTELWDRMFVPLHSLNFGIGGDQTQHLLWRINNGELENLSPKIIILLIGTNNHGNTAEEVVEGIMAIVDVILTKQSQAQLLVMGIPPRGRDPNHLREKITEINTAISTLVPARGSSCQFIDIDPSMFINADGLISHRDMHDYLHFTRAGYQKLMEPVLDETQSLMKNFIKADSASCGDPDN